MPYGWRPRPHDLVQLRQSTNDAVAYRTLFRGWRKAGFKVHAIRKLAGRSERESTVADEVSRSNLYSCT